MITSFRHDKARTLKRRQLLVALAILMFAVFLVRGPLSNFLGGLLHTLGRPFWGIKISIEDHIGSTVSLFRAKSSLEKENTLLRESLDLVAAEAYSRERLQSENEALKAKFNRNPESNLILARVLASPGVSPYDTLIIDAGTNESLSPGMEVFADGDFKIGEVTRVFRRSAVVTLYSSSDNELIGTLGPDALPVSLHGMGGGNFRVVLPRGVSVLVGDVVDIPALLPGYVGVVDAIERSEGSSLQAIFIKLPFNIFTLKWVYVALPVDDYAPPPSGEKKVIKVPQEKL